MLRHKMYRKIQKKNYSPQGLKVIAKKYFKEENPKINLNSLNAVEFIVEVEASFGVKIPDSQLSGVKTIEDMGRVIVTQL